MQVETWPALYRGRQPSGVHIIQPECLARRGEGSLPDLETNYDARANDAAHTWPNRAAQKVGSVEEGVPKTATKKRADGDLVNEM